jgi:hypothetical protein
LIIVETDDEFYSSLLPLAHLRYCFIDSSQQTSAPPLDFRYLGVTVSVEQFADLDAWRDIFLSRLRRFDLDSPAPIGTVVLARSFEEVIHMIATHPETDFYLPVEYKPLVAGPHVAAPGTARMFFLLSPESTPNLAAKR